MRDKIATSKRMDMWMGGIVPLDMTLLIGKLRINVEGTKPVQLSNSATFGESKRKRCDVMLGDASS